MARRGESNKRQFLMLAHKFEPKKHSIFGWFMSTKLDGQRFFWDGGVTRNMPADQVPWANVEKDARLRKQSIATGLWTRYGKVIYAPSWWLDELPPTPLDGELYVGPQQWQTLTSIVKTHEPNPYLWKSVKAYVFDSPSYHTIFSDGEISNPPNYTKTLRGAAAWAFERAGSGVEFPPTSAQLCFEAMVKWLRGRLDGNPIACAHEQTQLPFSTPAAMAQIDRRLAEVIDGGGEGLILRKHTSIWMPSRSHELLKYKPYNDAEATVVGYVWGAETDRGSKLMGLMGAAVVNFNGKIFSLSGFTEAERVLTLVGDGDSREGFGGAGGPVSAHWTNKMFPIGSRLTFRYRELSDSGAPKEARYFRKEII